MIEFDHPFNLLVINLPALNAEQLSDLPITVATILLSQTNQGRPKAVVTFWFGGFVALC